MRHPIPTTPAEITPGWLTQILHGAKTLTKSRVTSANVLRIGEDEAFTWGGLYRVTLAYDPPVPTAPNSLVAKLSPTDPKTRAIMQHANAREVDFYKSLAQGNDLPVPHCQHADFDPETGTSLVLLQDMGSFRSVSFIAGSGPADAVRVVKALAQIHAKWWNHARLSGMNGSALLSEFPLRQLWQNYTTSAQDMLPDVELPTDFLALGSHIAKNDTSIFTALMDVAPLTCLHRDLQIDNVLFDTAPGNDAAVLLDWQFAGKGRGAYDLGYFLISSIDPAQRRNSERGLVALYHAELLQHGIAGYSLRQCWTDYLQSVAGKLLMTVAATVLLDNSSDHKKAWRKADLTRLLAFCSDHNITAQTFSV